MFFDENEIDSDELEDDGKTMRLSHQNQTHEARKRNISRQLHENGRKTLNKLDLKPLQLKVIPLPLTREDMEKMENYEQEANARNRMHQQLREVQHDLQNLESALNDDIVSQNTVNQKQNKTTFDSDDDKIQSSIDQPKRVVIVHSASNNMWRVVWRSNFSFLDVLKQYIPKQIRKGQANVVFDDREWNINEFSFDIVRNDDFIYLNSDYSTNLESREIIRKKLVFSFTDGKRRKVLVPICKTWGYVLKKFGNEFSKLFFDGEELDLNEVIEDNKEIGNEDQIDVE